MRLTANSVLTLISDELRTHRINGCRLLVAVSGGGDSVALALALSEITERFSLQLILAHFDHHTRDPAEHRADRALVSDLANAIGAPLFYGSAASPPSRDEAAAGGGYEALARAQRYGFLESIGRSTGVRYCALAHTRDDQVETVAMRLLGGIDSPLLAGMPAIRESGGVLFVRPALEVSGDALRAYARSRGASWREDTTNSDLRYRRNLVRHEIVPQARVSWPRLGDDLLVIARAYRERSRRLSSAADQVSVADRAGKTIISAADLFRLAPDARLALLYQTLSDRGMISRENRPGHAFFAPLMGQPPRRNGIILEGRGMRFVLSGTRIELSRLG
ncbi:MAG: tRNA lysidine(34) synthetase TilS [Spirochaetales bacterium]